PASASAFAATRPTGPAPAMRTVSILSAARLQQVGELLLPPLGLAGGAVADGLRAGGDQIVAAALHALDLALHDAELGRVPLVVGRVDREHARLDLLQQRLRVV